MDTGSAGVQAQEALVDALMAKTTAGTLRWVTVSTFPLTFVARVRSNLFVLGRAVDDYPDLLAANSSFAVVIKTSRNLLLWLRVADAQPPFASDADQQLAAVRGMTSLVDQEGAK